MGLPFPQEFISINRSVERILRDHPGGGYVPELEKAFLEVDQRPAKDLRVQFSHAGEAAIVESDGKCRIGRISVTGVMDTSLTPDRGWHVFDLIHDGTINQATAPSNGGEHTIRDLDIHQMSELANWLINNTDTFLAS